MTLADYTKNPYAWPGGYQINAIMGDGEMMCHHCATTDSCVHEDATDDQDTQWCVIAFEIYWEGPPSYCCNCNKDILSEYGDPAKIDSTTQTTRT